MPGQLDQQQTDLNMKLSQSQLQQLDRDGFLVLPSLFSSEEVERLRSRQAGLLAQQCDSNIIERDSGEVRTAMAIHQRDELFANLARHPRLLGPARQVRPGPLYLQQVKINVKAAFSGEIWQWHYDFATHHRDDGVPEPLALNVHVFLDPVTPFNGPLYFIPGSHKHGALSAFHDTETTSYPLWVVDKHIVEKLVAKAELENPGKGIVAATGPAGPGLIFFDNLVHGSPNNMSPWERSIFSLILNPVSNALTLDSRPDFKHHRNLEDVVPLADDCLLARA
jgi:ectoine hydroxylase